MTRAGVESQDCLCLRRGWQTDMYLSTVRDTVIYTDITRLVCLSYTNHSEISSRFWGPYFRVSGGEYE